MTFKHLVQFLGAASCIALVNCSGIDEEDDDEQRKAGYSLDDAPSGPTRYIAGPGNVVPGTSSTTTTTTETTTTEPVEPAVTSSTTTTTTVPPVTSTPPPPTTPATTAPSYGSPVAGRRGFVYPPGVESKPENMVDVRDFTPGQKVRDPRTGKIFLVP